MIFWNVNEGSGILKNPNSSTITKHTSLNLLKEPTNKHSVSSNESLPGTHLILNKIYTGPIRFALAEGGPLPDAIQEMHCQWEGPLETSKGPRF